jgi:hypothetical protein
MEILEANVNTVLCATITIGGSGLSHPGVLRFQVFSPFFLEAIGCLVVLLLALRVVGTAAPRVCFLLSETIRTSHTTKPKPKATAAGRSVRPTHTKTKTKRNSGGRGDRPSL